MRLLQVVPWAPRQSAGRRSGVVRLIKSSKASSRQLTRYGTLSVDRQSSLGVHPTHHFFMWD